MAVEPSLMASREYSTWKRRPSGENVLGGVLEVEERQLSGKLETYLMPRSEDVLVDV